MVGELVFFMKSDRFQPSVELFDPNILSVKNVFNLTPERMVAVERYRWIKVMDYMHVLAE